MSPHVKRSKRIREARDLLTGKRVNLSEMYRRDALARGLGTAWVVPGEGSTWRELCCAFGDCGITDAEYNARMMRFFANWNLLHKLSDHANLLLTGSPLTAEDRARWESGNVE